VAADYVAWSLLTHVTGFDGSQLPTFLANTVSQDGDTPHPDARPRATLSPARHGAPTIPALAIGLGPLLIT
jgi:hypothetical protein